MKNPLKTNLLAMTLLLVALFAMGSMFGFGLAQVFDKQEEVVPLRYGDTIVVSKGFNAGRKGVIKKREEYVNKGVVYRVEFDDSYGEGWVDISVSDIVLVDSFNRQLEEKNE